MSESPDLVADYCRRIRDQFYDQPKRFYPERWLIVKALTYPASWLEKRGVVIREEKYRAILDTIILGVKRHGATGEIRYFGGYFLKVVQDHMKHHGEEYYEAGKSMRSVSDLTMKQILQHQEAADPRSEADRACETLAAIHKALKSPGGRRRRSLRDSSQGELF